MASARTTRAQASPARSKTTAATAAACAAAWACAAPTARAATTALASPTRARACAGRPGVQSSERGLHSQSVHDGLHAGPRVQPLDRRLRARSMRTGFVRGLPELHGHVSGGRRLSGAAAVPARRAADLHADRGRWLRVLAGRSDGRAAALAAADRSGGARLPPEDVVSLRVVLAAALFLAAGCDIRPFIFQADAAHDPRADAGGGTGGTGGLGGAGGTGGAGADDGGIGDGGSADACSPDLQNDPANCGRCGNVCSYANANPVCNLGTCQMGACLPGFHDLDGNSANGCEYACTVTNMGVEICDALDNDCNAVLDT